MYSCSMVGSVVFICVQDVNQVVWHKQGDYFAVVLDKADSASVIIHRLSRRQSQVCVYFTIDILRCVSPLLLTFSGLCLHYYLHSQVCVSITIESPNEVSNDCTNIIVCLQSQVGSFSCHFE